MAVRAQIVMNAISNAVKFTPPGAADGVSITARVSGRNQLVIDVTDAGPGLRQTLAQLMTEFGGNGSVPQREGVIRSSGTITGICVEWCGVI